MAGEPTSVASRVLRHIAACILLFGMLWPSVSAADVHDRVVASVDDAAITLSELEDQYARSAKLSSSITRQEVLLTMVNRLLLLREARKYRIEARTAEDVVREYVDLKIKAFIRVSEGDIEAFYRANIERFAGREYEQVRDEIEAYLSEKQLNERLKDTLDKLRTQAHIRMQLQSQ